MPTMLHDLLVCSMGECSETLVRPCFSGSCAFLGSSSLAVELLALESLSQKAGMGEVVNGN